MLQRLVDIGLDLEEQNVVSLCLEMHDTCLLPAFKEPAGPGAVIFPW